jgi:hypothetical protein
MNEVYAHTETTRKEQPAIHLRHMGRGLNDCRRQPRPQFAVAEGKIKAETRQYKEDQFRALEDRREASPTQISNLYRHNGNGFGDPSAERGMHRCQHCAQAHANQWENGFKLNISESQGWLQPEEFLVTRKIEKIDKKKVLREAVKIWSQSVEEEEDGFIEEDCSIDWASPPIYDTYPDEEVSSIYQVDFLGIDAILSKNFNQSCDKIYGVETTFLSKSEWIIVSSLGILITCGKGKARQGHGKPTRQGEAHGLQYKCGGVLMNKAIMFIMGYGLLVILRREDWNELTGHPKDRGKDSSNSGRILSNLGRMM